MKRLKRLIDGWEKANIYWGNFVGFWIYVIVIIICYEVISRYVFNSPTVWVMHLAQLIWGGFIVMGGAYTMIYEGHTRMDLLYNRLPSNRTRAALDSITSLLFFVFVITLLVLSAPYAWQAVLTDRIIHSWIWQAKEWPTILTIPIACALLLIQGTIVWVRNLVTAIKGGTK
jgi:TRAP-type mannitol/chloroaromatic compound transport system permease small subunit